MAWIRPIQGFSSGGGGLPPPAPSLWGRVAFVDDVNGDDATGAVNGPPFKTVQAALAVVLAGDCVYVLPGTYTLPAAGVTVPASVTLKGIDRSKVRLQVLGAVVATVLVTMSNGSYVTDLGLYLQSAAHVTLTGVSYGGTTATDARVQRCDLLVDNSGAGVGDSAVRGIRSFGTGTPPNGEATIEDCTIEVLSTRTGDKRAILVDTANNTFTAYGCSMRVTRSGGPAVGSYIAVETSGPGTCNLRECTASGTTADVSQTVGTLTLRAVRLLTNSANALGFSGIDAPAEVVFANTGLVVAGTLYMRPGTWPAAASEIRIRGPQRIVRKLSVRAQTGPGGGRTDAWTVRRNGVDTGLVVLLTGPATVASNGAVSIPFAEGDDLSIKQVGAAGSLTSDYVVSAEVY